MRVVVALDSFKGSVSSKTAGAAVRAGVLSADPSAVVEVFGVADGGEGTAAVLLDVIGGREVATDGVDALGRAIRSTYVELAGQAVPTAVVEASRTIGIEKVRPVGRATVDQASSYGLGQQVAQAIRAGNRRVIVTLGGTATTDGGMGLLQGLGAVFVDDGGVVLPHEGNLLLRPEPVRVRLWPDPPEADVTVLVDVAAPLAGPTGAARMFAPQKGADPDQVAELETRMTEWGRLLSDRCAMDVVAAEGAGAAGGCGAALRAVGAALEPGFSFVAAAIGLPEAIADADLVITGEGRIDAQSGLGKATAGVADLARASGAPVIALGGSVDDAADLDAMFDATFAIHDEPIALSEAMRPDIATAALARAAAKAATQMWSFKSR